MAVIHLASNDWLLVADGSRALVLRNDGSAVEPKLVTERTYAIENPPTREQGADKPGRVNDSLGRRSSVEAPDWHRIEEDKFMARLADDLEQDRKAGKFARLLIAAPPIALGALRDSLSRELKDAVVAEFNKDWTKMPVHEIEKAVIKVLAA